MKIDQRSFDLIVRQEVSSQAYYEAHYTHPEWPGVVSGITIGIGYDLGYQTAAQIVADWSGLVSDAMLTTMKRCAGIRGDAARAALPAVKPIINIPWDEAITVFSNRDIPHWTAAVQATLPNTDMLTSTCLGVLVSLAYNRGCSFDLPGDRYAEMREIKAHMASKNPAAIPAEIRSMKRLWPNTKGLRDRREAEAALFELGLTSIGIGAKVAPAPAEYDQSVLASKTSRTKPSRTTVAQHATAGAVVVGSVAVAVQTHLAVEHVILIGWTATIVAIAIWCFWYDERNPT